MTFHTNVFLVYHNKRTTEDPSAQPSQSFRKKKSHSKNPNPSRDTTTFFTSSRVQRPNSIDIFEPGPYPEFPSRYGSQKSKSQYNGIEAEAGPSSLYSHVNQMDIPPESSRSEGNTPSHTHPNISSPPPHESLPRPSNSSLPPPPLRWSLESPHLSAHHNRHPDDHHASLIQLLRSYKSDLQTRLVQSPPNPDNPPILSPTDHSKYKPPQLSDIPLLPYFDDPNFEWSSTHKRRKAVVDEISLRLLPNSRGDPWDRMFREHDWRIVQKLKRSLADAERTEKHKPSQSSRKPRKPQSKTADAPQPEPEESLLRWKRFQPANAKAFWSEDS